MQTTVLKVKIENDHKALLQCIKMSEEEVSDFEECINDYVVTECILFDEFHEKLQEVGGNHIENFSTLFRNFETWYRETYNMNAKITKIQFTDFLENKYFEQREIDAFMSFIKKPINYSAGYIEGRENVRRAQGGYCLRFIMSVDSYDEYASKIKSDTNNNKKKFIPKKKIKASKKYNDLMNLVGIRGERVLNVMVKKKLYSDEQIEQFNSEPDTELFIDMVKKYYLSCCFCTKTTQATLQNICVNLRVLLNLIRTEVRTPYL